MKKLTKHVFRDKCRQIKTLLRNRKENLTKSVIFDQMEYNDDCDIVNKFNTLFIDSISSIRQSIDKVQYVSQITCEPSNLFKFYKINITELENIVKQMKDKPGQDCVSNKIIIDNLNVLENDLPRIINTSLETHIFPENCPRQENVRNFDL